MKTPHEDSDYHKNKIMVAVAEKLGLDPSMIISVQVEGDGSGTVQVSYEGVGYMPEQEFQDILNAHMGQVAE